jgi:hypothetical protein
VARETGTRPTGARSFYAIRIKITHIASAAGVRPSGRPGQGYEGAMRIPTGSCSAAGTAAASS